MNGDKVTSVRFHKSTAWCHFFSSFSYFCSLHQVGEISRNFFKFSKNVHVSATIERPAHMAHTISARYHIIYALLSFFRALCSEPSITTKFMLTGNETSTIQLRYIFFLLAISLGPHHPTTSASNCNHKRNFN